MVLRERGSKAFGRLRIGLTNGIFLSEIRLYTATIDVASVATNVVDAQTFTVTGLAVNDIILAVVPNIDIGMGMGTIRVSTRGLSMVTGIFSGPRTSGSCCSWTTRGRAVAPNRPPSLKAA